jgi:N-acetylmuramoyl-L-alanine amidase
VQVPFQFVSRETWGAITPRANLLPLVASKIQGIVVHHTTGTSIDPDQMIVAHDHYHYDTKSWGGGLAYCWLVSADGRIWEGRGWNRGGATGRDWDYRTVSVAFIGDSNQDWPVDAQAALTRVVAHVRSRYGQGLWLKPHSDFKATDCPGGALRGWIPSMGLEAPTEAVKPSQDKGIDWGVLMALFAGLRTSVEQRELRRWRKNFAPSVMAVQARLNSRGFPVGAVDGVFGRRTQRAVRDFQSTQGFLRPNGRVNLATWDALFIQ